MLGKNRERKLSVCQRPFFSPEEVWEMKGAVSLRRAKPEDAQKIVGVLRSNLSEVSLFQQPVREVRRNLPEFVLAEDSRGSIVGCAQLHWYKRGIAEILAVSVHPHSQGQGVGKALMKGYIDSALSQNARLVWLATAKPTYFARYGFEPISKWELSLGILLHKLRLVFQQPPSRWLPALVGRHTFMKLDTGRYQRYTA